jgi:hypothetical protein
MKRRGFIAGVLGAIAGAIVPARFRPAPPVSPSKDSIVLFPHQEWAIRGVIDPSAVAKWRNYTFTYPIDGAELQRRIFESLAGDESKRPVGIGYWLQRDG